MQGSDVGPGGGLSLSGADAHARRGLATSAGRSLAVLCAYYAAAGLGVLMPHVGTHLSLIWLPTGIAMPARWPWSPSMAPAIFVAAFAANITFGSSLWLAACIGAGNVAGPWIATAVLRRLRFDGRLLQRRDIAAFCAAALLGM